MKNLIFSSMLAVLVSALGGSFAHAADADVAFLGYCTVIHTQTGKMLINPPREVRLKLEESTELLRFDGKIFTFKAMEWIEGNKAIEAVVLNQQNKVEHAMMLTYKTEIPYQFQLEAGAYSLDCWRDQ